MAPERPRARTRGPWSTRKRDRTPKGLHRLPDGRCGIQYLCALGCRHQEKVSPKSEAERQYRARRTRAHQEAGWCPKQARRQQRERARDDADRQARRITFRQAAEDYLVWAREHRAGWFNARAILRRAGLDFDTRALDEITTAEIEDFRNGLLGTLCRSTENRYRDGLSGLYT